MRIAHALAILALGCTLGCPSPGPTSTADAKAQKAPAAAKTGDSPAGPANPALTDPSLAKETAPDSYRVQLDTTKGKVVIEVRREWSPQGADRFYNLVKIGFFDDVAFFRAIDNFMVQFGLSGDPAVQQAWNAYSIPDDPVAGQSNKRGTITFAKKNNPNSRTTQVFINYRDNAPLDAMGFTPFGEVIEGMDVIDNLYKGYGEGAPKGKGPDQMKLTAEGNAYLQRDFPELDYVKKASIVEG